MTFDPTRPLAIVHGPRNARRITPKTRTTPYEGVRGIRVLATDRICPVGFTTVIAVHKNGMFGPEEFIWNVDADGVIGNGTSTDPLFLINVTPQTQEAPTC